MKKSAIIKQILTYCSSQWLDIWSILIYICLFHRYFQSVLKLTLFTAPLQGPLHCPVFDLSRRRRGKHGSQSRRQPWQPHDSGNGVLSEKPQEDHVLPGIEEQALPALRHLPSQRNLRQAGQHVRDKIQRLMLITVLIFLTVELYRVRYNITEALSDGSFYFNVGFIIIVIFFFFVNRYMELVHTDSNFEPEESFFQLFSDPRSTRLTRVQLREDFVRDRDLEAIRKQVGCCKLVRDQFFRISVWRLNRFLFQFPFV